ncbi:MAG: hypothetical protein KF718_19875 [Polyangiaceae bacterium]|nr:hypothetical protein [Polyangiaceae bacterium]
MSPPQRQSSLERIARAARFTELRLRLDAAVARFVLLLSVPLVFAVGALTYVKVARPGWEAEGRLLAIAAALLLLPVVAAAVAFLRRRPPHLGAITLDRHHQLADRLASALQFRELPASDRTPLMDAAIEDALDRARKLEPRRAAPLHLPREVPLVVLLVAALAGLSLLEVRTVRELPPERLFQPMVMTGDDLDLFRDVVKDLDEKSQDPEVQAAVRRFNQLIEDIAAQRLDRTEVFKRLEALERELQKSAEADKDALNEGLKNLAKELEKSDLTKPIAQAMQQQNLPDAEKAMRELAEKLKSKKDKPSAQQLEKLREALKKASEQTSERLKRIEEQRKKLEEEKKRLLEKKREQDGGLNQNDKRLLDKKERQLERLDREKDQAQRAQRQLSRLDRELAQAAEDLLKELGMSAKDLENAAEDLNRMAQEEMTEQEKEELRRRLQEMRELLRQQGKGGKERMQRLMRFGQRARGKQGQGQEGQEGQDGQRGQGKGQKPGSGQGDDMLVMGPGQGGKTMPMPGSGKGQGGGEMPGSGQGQGSGDKPGGQGAGQGGEQWGTGHDGNLRGEESSLKGQTKSVTAAAADTGEGGASSQVIYGAAERGFTGRQYKQVYTDYKTVAERVMNEEQIPPGYRFYVQRYFQLIRPRE